jgi:hypothetical protein
VALLVLLCGCRVSSGAAPVDATTPRGDGLAERITTDAALWADVRPPDTTGTERLGGGADAVGADVAGADVADGASSSCQLLEPSCPTRQACYPFPFEFGPPSGETSCRAEGSVPSSSPCRSQLDCDGENLCITPEQSDAVCLRRCDLNGPNCPPGTACLPLARYPGVGFCTL